MNFAQPGQLFEDLGITYIGVVPGHDLRACSRRSARRWQLPGPVIVHVRTQKGHGYRPAEADQVGFHGAALPPMDLAPKADAFDGTGARNRREPDGGPTERRESRPRSPGDRVRWPSEAATPDRPDAGLPRQKTPNYTAVFASELIELAKADDGSARSPPGCRPGPACRKFQAAFPTASTTSASPSSTR